MKNICNLKQSNVRYKKSPFGGFRGLLIFILFFTSPTFAQQLAKFKVHITEDRINTPVSLSLDELNYNTDKGNLVLYEITSAGEKVIPSQLETGDRKSVV